jgi:glycosyltransferase involved in cell wall biosynthesis
MIGIDYTPAYEQGGGIGRYVRELIGALAALDTITDYRLFVAGATPDKLSLAPGNNFQWRSTRIPPKWTARLWHRAQLPIPINLFTGAIRLYHATDFTLPPVASGTKTILTVHDLSFVRAPETASPNLRKYLDVVVPRSVRRADHILADSQATKDDLIALYNTPPDKITVLLSGVSERFAPATTPQIQEVRAKYNIGDAPYILSVGTVQPRKNYERLIRALAQLPAAYNAVKLVIAGGRGWLQDPIHQAVIELNLQDRVQFLGFAEDSDLPALYSGATMLAYPSLYEGFGLPILEAFRCRTPVLTSANSSLSEVSGEAAVIVDPYSVDSIGDGLQRLLDDTDLRARLVTMGEGQAAPFTWGRAAGELRAVYDQMLTGSLANSP